LSATTSIVTQSHTQFLIYRLFSLAGLIPIGGYVVMHLLVNATVVDSPAMYQAQVDKIHALGMLLPLAEWGLIYLPLMFHAAVGLWVISGGLPNAQAYPYGPNIRYTLQRGTALIVLAFIIWHVMHMKYLGGLHGGGQFDPHHAASSLAAVVQPLWVKVFYVIGVLAAVYHLSNGLWTLGITWGLWLTEGAMRRAGYICTGFGLVLGFVGLSALWGAAHVDIPEAQQVETRIQQFNEMQRGEISAEQPLAPATPAPAAPVGPGSAAPATP
jgi:succinate dehydrogenase / fumarate reductase cytochrome b subunit